MKSLEHPWQPAPRPDALALVLADWSPIPQPSIWEVIRYEHAIQETEELLCRLLSETDGIDFHSVASSSSNRAI